ncbi:hypothetical protein ZK99_001845 [Salmonella enterica subsp. enterica]|uniref:Uncharacterized protein n=1 Tax=Salmonella enterica subsp. enterica serovar Kottbus TaxID=224727 RepID=A0A5J0S5V7_SALET|nr:hypothetical protein [Salmonella enterica subsp. enterica serovar Kottbus]EDE8444511.1 hypothetical protein [Salmonella enterica subsp. enterica serovar Pomona]EDN4394098.1 hypothetical protein [Salmonella enterica subsp. enterica]EBS1860805.1 hypothetical protein [Salmonella enterica subsp. enterica serovar Kottbus]EBW1601918.1 hypothetical protein [Salmonella enterica subsp. enterica serovar Kottbus]
MVELIISALRLLGALWMVATFIVVAGCFIRLVGDGKDLVGVLFGSILLWVIIGVAPVAVAKMAWRFIN